MVLPRRIERVVFEKGPVILQPSKRTPTRKQDLNVRSGIDHHERRDVILTKSLQLFEEQGYHGVTYQKIADRCGLSRTTLYKYFQEKREIFDEAILRVTVQMDADYRIILQQGGPVSEQLIRMMEQTFDRLLEQRLLLNVILDYLIHLKRSGKPTIRRITKHTYKVRRLFFRLLLHGVETGELRPMEIRSAANALYGMFEAYIFQMTVTDRLNPDQSKASARLLIDGMKATPKG